MNPRTTAILFAIALALGGFVYFYELEGEEGRRQAEDLEKQLFPDVEADAIEWIQLRTSDERDVRVERSGESWQVVEPLAFPGDDFALDTLASTVAEISSEAVFEEPQGPEVYGLDAPGSEVRFGAGDSEYALRTGDKAPLGSSSYAAVVGEAPVYTVPTFRANALRKAFDDLRDKRILDFDGASVERLSVSWPDARVELARVDDEWRVEAPVVGLADQATVSDLISELSFLRAASFEDEPRPDAETGLDAPAFSVELELAAPVAEDGAVSEASAPRRLGFAIGSVERDEHRYVRAERPSLYRIRTERLDEFPRELKAYRFKQLGEFGSLEARELELVFHPPGGDPVTVTATREGGSWSSEPEALEPSKLERLVDELSRLRATEILAEEMGSDELRALGLDPPRVALRALGGDEGEERELAVVHIGELRGGEGIAAQRADLPTVFQLDLASAEHIPVNLEALRNRFLVVEEELPPEPIPDAPTSSDALLETPFTPIE